jgi:hypothetical protein|tara:strand:- start:405 stop:812 length:408 start_codon:yes stop_codon:yes gene_type:complete
MNYNYKIILLVLTIIIYTFIYSFVNPINFSGINIIQDKIKDKLGEEQIYESFTDDIYKSSYDIDKEIVKSDVKKLINEEDKKIKEPTYRQRLIDSFYFSTITACLLGYGDIYPITNLSKLLVSTQGLFTIALILY